MDTQTYHCKVTNYIIQYRVKHNIAIMDTIYTDYKNIHSLLNLLRISHDDLEKKGIKKIQHKVTSSDYNIFIKPCGAQWDIIEEDKLTQTITLECSIDNMLQNIGLGLGIN